MKRPKPTAILVDRRNWLTIKQQVIDEMKSKGLLGIDLETHDHNRHPGLNRMMKVDDDGFKGGNTRLVFDTNRTIITGFSVYADESDKAYYLNLNHKDVENRLTWAEAREVIDAAPPTSKWLCHNAPYEITMFRKCYGLHLPNVICTMQLSVTAFNDDTYPRDEFLKPGLGEIASLFPQVRKHFATYQKGSRDPLTFEQAELLSKVVAKESKAAHSWIGYMKTMTYTHGLKKLALRFLQYEQTTFAEVLGDKPHMGELTGEEVCAYGADDAWVCVHLFHELLAYIIASNPKVLPTFFSQENPMVYVYSDSWGDGVRIDIEQVFERQKVARKVYAQVLRDLKAEVKKCLPFPFDIHDKLVKYDPKAYGKEGTAERYRQMVYTWAMSPDSDDDFAQCYQVKNPIAKQWAEEKKVAESKGMSINYYQVKRCILLDLCRCSFQLSQGKPASDKDAIEVMKDRWIKKEEEHTPEKHQAVLNVIALYQKLATVEQVIKLFINLYLNLTDPETGRVYPVLNSLLTTRRMAMAVPNLSQLSKFDENNFVRSFFLADEDDHVFVTADWSSVELVLIGDQSGDPGFAAVFGQLPFGDLHTDTAAALNEVSVAEIKTWPNYKEQRRDAGKVPNFGYWYSGALGQAAQVMNWGSEKMWEMTEKYRNRFPVAEAWRVGVIQQTRETGIVRLPDEHTRIRYESTYEWAYQMKAKFSQYGEIVENFGDLVIKKLQTRSGNQAVNAKIQGTSATVTKRSILKQKEVIRVNKWDANFKFPVHDEVVYSVHKDIVVPFIATLRESMCNHPDIVTKLKLDVQVAIGFNYLNWDAKTNPLGTIELDEVNKGFPALDESRWGKKLDPSEYQTVVDYLFKTRDQIRKEKANV